MFKKIELNFLSISAVGMVLLKVHPSHTAWHIPVWRLQSRDGGTWSQLIFQEVRWSVGDIIAQVCMIDDKTSWKTHPLTQ